MITQLQEFGALIRKHRREKDMSQEELAENAGISRTYLSQIEQGRAANLSLRLSTRLRELLGLLSVREQMAKAEAVRVHPSLQAYAEAENLTDAEQRMLMHVSYRGKRPETIDQWRFLYNLIKTTIDNFDKVY